MVIEDWYPARSGGLLSHVFQHTGVYEIQDGERPSLKCVLLVKPSPKQHVVKITTNDFTPGTFIRLNVEGNLLSDLSIFLTYHSGGTSLGERGRGQLNWSQMVTRGRGQQN